MRLRFQRPDGSIFEARARPPIDGEGWMLLPPEPDDMPVLPYPSAPREETDKVTIALWEMACCTCLRVWVEGEKARARGVADVVGQLQRLTSERDSWKLRAESAEQIVKVACGKGGGEK